MNRNIVMNMSISIFRIIAILQASVFLTAWIRWAEADQHQDYSEAGGFVAIHALPPDKRGGKAYQLVYTVGVPIEVLWKFKTDFQNDFLVTNKYIREHHFIYKDKNAVITENKYSNAPDIFFKWKTTVFAESHRLEFILMNPEECGQRYHYGHIQLEAVRDGTRVTQVAYFDFWGASVWAAYPWGGGMRDFLKYNAEWERRVVLRLKNKYSIIDRGTTPADEEDK